MYKCTTQIVLFTSVIGNISGQNCEKQPQEVHFMVKQMKQSNLIHISKYFNKFLKKYKKGNTNITK
jgi:hypothetical protein